MKTYTINLMDNKGKTFIRTYRSTLVPIAGDMISLSDKEVFTVRQRLLPSNETSDVVLLFGSIN